MFCVFHFNVEAILSPVGLRQYLAGIGNQRFNPDNKRAELFLYTLVSWWLIKFLVFKMKKLCLLIFLLSIYLHQNLFSQNQKVNNIYPFTQSKIKAVYGFSKQLSYFKNKSNAEIVSTLKNWNVNAIFGGYEDIELVEQLHRAGIKVFAEVSFFVGVKWWQEYPDSRPIGADGKLLEKEEWYGGVNPTNVDVFQAVLKKVQKIITTSEVDGIWLDFFRWPCHWESPNPNLHQTSFDDRTIDLFLKEKQITIPNDISNSIVRNQWILNNHLTSWTEFKCDQIVRLAEKVRRFVMLENKNVIIGLFHIPWTDKDFDGAIKKIVGQDLSRLSPHIDIFSPMVYHAMCGKSSQWVEKMITYVNQETNKPVLPIIQSMNIPREITDIEFNATLNSGLQAQGSAGIIVFNIKSLSEAKLTKLIEIFDQY